MIKDEPKIKRQDHSIDAPICHGRPSELKAVVIPCVYFFQCKACGKVRWKI